MKILYLHPSAWTGEYIMLRSLRDLGHRICVLEERPGLVEGPRHVSSFYLEPGDKIDTLWYDPRRGLEKAITWILDRPFKRAFNGRNLAHRMWIIRAAYRSFRPDAIVCSEGFSYGIPASFLKQMGLLPVPLLVGYIGGDVLDCPEAEYGKRRTRLTDWLIRRSAHGPEILRPVSPRLRDQLIADGAVPERLRVCPSHLVADPVVSEGVLARRDAVRRQICKKYDIPKDCLIVVTLSSNQKGKGVHVMAEAWGAILREMPRCHWLLCGPHDPWLKDGVWPILQPAEKEHVHTTGGLSGVAVFEHLAAADLHVNPSLCEGLNMVTVEAASVAVPTVCSDGAGIAHWVASQDAGSVVRGGDAAALAAATLEALNDQACLSRWRRNASELVKEFYPERIAGCLLELLRAAGAPLGAMR